MKGIGVNRSNHSLCISSLTWLLLYLEDQVHIHDISHPLIIVKCSSQHYEPPLKWLSTPKQVDFEKINTFLLLQNISKNKTLVSSWHVSLFFKRLSKTILIGLSCKTGPCLPSPFPAKSLFSLPPKMLKSLESSVDP